MIELPKDTRRFLSLLGILTLLISIPLTLLLVGTRQKLRKEALVAEGPAVLSLISPTTASPSQNVDIYINLDTDKNEDPGSQNVTNFQTTILFDPNIFEPQPGVAEVDVSTAELSFPQKLKNEIKVSAGIVRFDYSIDLFATPKVPVNGSGTVGVLKLKVKAGAPLGDTSISFYTESAIAGDKWPTKVFGLKGGDILGNTFGIDPFTVQATLAITTEFEGNPDVPAIENVIVKVGSAPETTKTFHQRLDSSGYFDAAIDLAGVTSGLQAVVVKGPLHLSQKKTITIPQEIAIEFIGTDKLLGGDLSGNDKVWDEDVWPMLNAYGKTEAAACTAADITMDGAVSGDDVNIFIRNFGRSGEK